MKIAIVHNLPPGGQKRALYEQVKRLSKMHHLDLFTLSSTNEQIFSLLSFVQNHITTPYKQPELFPDNILSIYNKLPLVYKQMATKINSGNYDVAFIHPCYLTQSPYILKYLTIPSVYYCPEPKREFYEYIPRVSNILSYYGTLPLRLPIKWIDRQNVRYASKILTNSEYSRKMIKKVYGINSTVNYLGVDSNMFTLGSDPETYNIVLTVGEFSLHKGHDFIIRSLAKVHPKLRPDLVIAGHGGIEKNYLLSLAKKLRVSITFGDNVSDSRLVELYHKAKVFLYAARNEPFGLVLLEAAACGLPIVAVDEGGVREIVSKDEIGVLTNRNEDEFSNQIIKLLKISPSKKDKMARHEFIKKNWSWEKSIDELEKIFVKLNQ